MDSQDEYFFAIKRVSAIIVNFTED